METTETQETLRDTLSANFDALERATVTDVTAPAAATEVKTTEPAKAAEPAKAEPAKAERARDKDGKFIEGKAEVRTVATKAPATSAAPAAAATVAAPEVKRPARPSSWKKEHWDDWEKLDPRVADYILQRESEAIRGVSAYKNEWDRAKPLIDALAPYQPFLQQRNMRPEQFVSSLAQADQVLRFAGPQQKLKFFAKLATDYQIPLHEMLEQREDGKVYLNQQYFKQEAAPAMTQQDIDRIVTQKVNKQVQHTYMQQQFKSFIESKDANGNPKHPHFEAVKAEMGGLLQSGICPDLPSAYEAALRLPKHSALFDALQQQQRAAEDAEKKRVQADAASRARANAVSTRSTAPTSMATAGKTGTGLREQLSENFDRILGAG